MAGLFTIELKNLRFFADHGLHTEEQKTGNEFELNVSIEYNAPQEIITSIDQTINYVNVFCIVRDEFSQKKDLLETCAMQIADKLEKQFPQIKKLTISIKKLHAPITNFAGSVGIIYSRIIK